MGGAAAAAAATAAAACARAQAGARAVVPAPAPISPGTSGAAVAGMAGSAAGGASGGTPGDTSAMRPGAAHHEWDLSWTERLGSGATHKQVFDAPEIADGTVLHQARMFFVNYKEVYNASESDLRAVLVIRHHGIPMVLGDEVWAHYPFIGKKITKLKDPTTGDWTRRNPFLHAKAGDSHALVWPDGGLDSLIGRGAIVLACNLAFNGFATRIADRTKQRKETVQDELKAALVPGVTLVPSGIFGVIRAEQGGCAYIRAT